MTKEAFIEKWRHELSGMVVDAATHSLHGAQLAAMLRGLMQKVDRHLAQMYVEMLASKPPEPVKRS